MLFRGACLTACESQRSEAWGHHLTAAIGTWLPAKEALALYPEMKIPRAFARRRTTTESRRDKKKSVHSKVHVCICMLNRIETRRTTKPAARGQGSLEKRLRESGVSVRACVCRYKPMMSHALRERAQDVCRGCEKKTRALRDMEDDRMCGGKASRPENANFLGGFHVHAKPWHRDSVEARIGFDAAVILLQFQARSVILLLSKRPKRETRRPHTRRSHSLARHRRKGSHTPFLPHHDKGSAAPHDTRRPATQAWAQQQSRRCGLTQVLHS